MIIFSILGFIYMFFAIFILILGISLIIVSFIGKKFSLEMTGTGVLAVIFSAILIIIAFFN